MNYLSSGISDCHPRPSSWTSANKVQIHQTAALNFQQAATPIPVTNNQASNQKSKVAFAGSYGQTQLAAGAFYIQMQHLKLGWHQRQTCSRFKPPVQSTMSVNHSSSSSSTSTSTDLATFMRRYGHVETRTVGRSRVSSTLASLNLRCLACRFRSFGVCLTTRFHLFIECPCRLTTLDSGHPLKYIVMLC